MTRDPEARPGSSAQAAGSVRRRLTRPLLVFATLVALGYAAVLLWFRVNENALLFHPERVHVERPPEALELHSRDVALSSLDGTALRARLIPPPDDGTAAPTAAGWILYLHGAGGNVGKRGYNQAWAKFRRMGLGVLAVDYRGFGESDGTPSEEGLYTDADAAYAYLTQELHVPPARVVIYGYSLGSAVAIDLALRAPAAGLIVEGAFTSVAARGAELYPYLPVRWLARNRFASADKIARVPMPKLFIHARGDTIVPIAHGRELFALARPPKYFQEVAGGHTDAHEVDPGFFAAIAHFIGGLGIPVRAN